MIDSGYDIPSLNKYLDYVSVMTYDYHGQWDGETGHVAPMYQHQQDLRAAGQNFLLDLQSAGGSPEVVQSNSETLRQLNQRIAEIQEKDEQIELLRQQVNNLDDDKERAEELHNSIINQKETNSHLGNLSTQKKPRLVNTTQIDQTLN